jgi:hypothetical protein
MSTAVVLEREEYVEQAYFFRVFRERVADNQASQDILQRIHEEILSSTRLPYAIQFLAAEMRHTGLLASGFTKLPHYFTAFQAYVLKQAEDATSRFPMPTAMVVLEREALYKSGPLTKAGLFVYQFEAIARNRLGYDPGLTAVEGDPPYGPEWKEYIDLVRRQAGVIDFADLVYLRSELYVADERRENPGYEPPVPPLFAEKEGKIARASRGRDPLYLFAALQRQLGYPEVPRLQPADDLTAKLATYEAKIRELDARIRMLEAEQRGSFDPMQFGKPDMFRGIKDDEPK